MFTLEIELNGLAKAVLEREAMIRAAALRAAGRIRKEMEEYAKYHHRWNNQTGDTQASVKAVVIPSVNEIAVFVYAETPYSKFLELARDGRWAWLHPAVIALTPKIRLIMQEELGHGGGFEATGASA